MVTQGLWPVKERALNDRRDNPWERDPSNRPQPSDSAPPSRQAPDRVPWGVRELALGFVGAIGLYFVAIVPLVIWLADRYDEDSAEFLLGAFIATAVWQGSLVLLLLVILRKYGNIWPNLGARRPQLKRPGWHRAPIIGAIPWFIVLAFLASLMARLLLGLYVIIVQAFDADFLLPEQQIPEEVFDSIAVQVAAGLSVVVAAPIVEELFFRGFLFAGIRKLIGVWPAALISSLVFAVVHAQSGLIIPFTGVGLLLAYLYHRSRSIYVPIAMHFFFNAVSFLVLVFMPELRVEE
jgi:membrane protease YdiL (CAAX protease family)